MAYDYTDAPPQRDFTPIPHNTVATITMHVRPGGAGEDGMLQRSKAGDAEMINGEMTVTDGEHKGRKFWQYFVLTGTTSGHATAADISRGLLKGIVDSAKGLKPDDKSDAARAARTLGVKDFDGMAFIGRIGVEKGKPRNDGSNTCWPDKNYLIEAITPDRTEWHAIEQPPPFNGGGASAGGAVPVERPDWAS
jgi:hypothetical protein